MSDHESLEQIRASYQADQQRQAEEARIQAEYAEASRLLFDQARKIVKTHGDFKHVDGWQGYGGGVIGGRRVTLHYRETPVIVLPSGNEQIGLSVSSQPSAYLANEVYYLTGVGIDPLEVEKSKKHLFTLEFDNASDWNEQPLSPELFGHVGDLLRDIETALVVENRTPRDHTLESFGFDGEDPHFHLRQAAEDES
jgi:hypothetical protein